MNVRYYRITTMKEIRQLKKCTQRVRLVATYNIKPYFHAKNDDCDDVTVAVVFNMSAYNL